MSPHGPLESATTLRPVMVLMLALGLAACTTVAAPSAELPTSDASPSAVYASGKPRATTAGTPRAASPSTPGASPKADPGFVVVALGDSIPFNLSDDCPGCTGFVDSYGKALEKELGRPVTVLNRSRHDGARSIDLRRQVMTDTQLLVDLATADIVLVSIGFNDLPPFRDAYEGCPDPIDAPNPPVATLVELLPATSRECLDTVVQVIGGQVADVLAAVREHAPDARIATLDAYDPDIGWSEYEGVKEATLDRIYATDVYWFDHWRDELCARAAAVDAVCVDIYAGFNGPKGRKAAGDLLAADYTHPSQKGNDMIRDLLLKAHLVQIGGS
jgi:lysophospholipase L1-like esterase